MIIRGRARRQALADVFEDTKRYLAKDQDSFNSGDQQEFICLAIDMVDRNYYDRRRAKNLVQYRIRPYLTADSWLYDRLGLRCTAMSAVDFDRIQQWRHQWLDQLIAEFSADYKK